jgi:predicted deacylase
LGHLHPGDSGIGMANWPPRGLTTRRWLGTHESREPGPTMVVVGGIHGNEPAGVIAVQRVLRALQRTQPAMRGRLLGLGGNLRGLAQDVRYLDRDLNRRWYPDDLARLRDQDRGLDSPEDGEQRELLEIFEQLDRQYDHPLIVLDLHSFSAEGPPFSVVADALRNRPIALDLRVPIIFGLEEAVDGTLLGYLADLGHVAIGFEAGQHEDPRTVENHVAAIWQAMVTGGLLEPSAVPEFERHRARLAEAAGTLPRAVEIVYRHAIRPEDEFRMEPGWVNFQPLRRGERVARDLRGDVTSPSAGCMLMPLYQGLGEDGFFVAREVGNVRMQMSAALRQLGVDGLLPWLPGVAVNGERNDEIELRGIADRPIVQEALRMLGYRKELGGTKLARRRQSESRRRGAGGGES